MKELHEIMIKNPITIANNATISDAILLFSTHRVGCLPVVDPSGKLVSFLSDGDVINFLARRTKQQDRMPAIFHAVASQQPDSFMQLDPGIYSELEKISVLHCATKYVQYAYPEDNLAEIATLMDNRRLKHIPVVDRDSKQIIGLLARRDIVLSLFDVLSSVEA